ncbi:hypothetical protein [Streptomyces sp. BE133]|uniref:hypothetical protein n=1 Tax=Streptomyces sp. BE133 TaxID=3002523 RepID=UPI002E77CC2F|nr:hypothetical protein [Streptomyces sp. BE133]MEE1806423.1 hypothetical protein [Streptomyces sp. BE133]
MDAELLALASAAGTAVVTALTTDLWERARASVGALWERAYPDRAATVQADLTDTRTLLLTTDEVTPGGTDIEEVSAQEWRLRFHRLLSAHPDLAQELRRVLVEELTPALPAQQTPQSGSTVFHAAPTGHARVYQSAGDMNINER